MSAGALHHVSLDYQLLWNVHRQVAGVRLGLAPHEGHVFDTSHLLGALSDLWPQTAVPLTLSTPSAGLLADLLDLTPPKLARIEVTDALLPDPFIAQRVMRARQRGLPLVWRGEPGSYCKPAYADCFAQSILALSTEDALAALRIALRKNKDHGPSPDSVSPVRSGQTYEGVASRLLADHCLDQQGAAALLAWPTEDALHADRQGRIQPDRRAMTRLLAAIDADAPMERIERGLSQEPILCWRFLRWANSAGAGLNREIDGLRQGLMVLGLSRVKAWLQEQIPRACTDLNLQPVRIAMVLRAQCMAELLAVGEGDALKRELYLCGLLSQIDLLLGEPLPSALHVIPLPERICAALFNHAGPYWPYLDIATALETPQSATLRALCAAHDQNMEDVNLALLRTLAASLPG